jgi:hypothetical protein
LFKGKYNAPTGLPPVVEETGAYTGELRAKYEAMAKQLAAATRKMINFVNTVVWQDGKMSGTPGFPEQVGAMLAERSRILNTTEFLDLKKEIEKA